MKLTAHVYPFGHSHNLIRSGDEIHMPYDFWKRYLPWRTREWYSYVLIALGILGLATNLTAMRTVIRTKSSRNSPLHWIIASLSCVNIFSALLSGLIIAWFFPAYKPFDARLLFNMGMTASYGTTLLAAAHVSFLAVAQYLSYKKPICPRTAKIAICLIWLLVVVFAAMLSASWFMPDSIYDTGNADILYEVQLGIAAFLFLALSLTAVLMVSSIVRMLRLAHDKCDPEFETRDLVKKTGIKPFSHVLSVMLLLGLFVIGYMPRCACFLYEFTLYWRLTDSANYFPIWMVNTDFLDYFRFAEYLCVRLCETFIILLYGMKPRYAISELWKDKNGFFGRSQAANRPLVTPGSHEDFPDSDKTPIVDQLQN